MAVTIDGSAGITTNAGGSVNPSTSITGINYSCRAWVNFNGTGTVAIRASGNVTSITDNAVGDYTVNFTTAMSDVNYTIVGAVANTNNNWTSRLGETSRGQSGLQQFGATAPTTSACRIETMIGASSGADGGDVDFSAVYVVFFR
jgi:hypothetical protein